MSEFKYVVIRVNNMYDYPVIFPDKICHDDMADASRVAIVQSIQQEQGKEWKTEVISAGFISLDTLKVTRHGSETLGIKENKERAIIDNDLIATYSYMHGVVM